ncbi:hypothetical protein [Sphingorhabdus sp. 109]|jgi:hypothetical protein|uniref:hypothetical protein n=1 Tax=Sphingorhabdus sp. 109 TaxID=2653173 RepID=UPI0012F01ABC|nr:hypothetical protein [Sphingorhabdus sp. 109]VWX59628.1 hypothetical protein SPHINGOR109_50014 [Sphingorhabdus sp. 109]
MACGAGVWAIVTTDGWQAVVVLVTVRLVRFILRAGSPFLIARARSGFFFDIFLTYGAAGASETCTAPPPISAPPQVQAHNFAKAIRTDIIYLSSASDIIKQQASRSLAPVCRLDMLQKDRRNGK